MQFTVYQMSDGRIVRYGECPTYDALMQAGDGEYVHQGEAIRDDLFYMPDGVKTPRPALDVPAEFLIAADGLEAVSFALPAGSQVWCLTTGEEWLDEAEFHFTTEVPGSWRYRIDPAFPYRENVRITIHAA